MTCEEDEAEGEESVRGWLEAAADVEELGENTPAVVAGMDCVNCWSAELLKLGRNGAAPLTVAAKVLESGGPATNGCVRGVG